MGDCDVGDNCVSSKNYPENYGNMETCSVNILQDVFAIPSAIFSLEKSNDNLIIGGVSIQSSKEFPRKLYEGEKFSWNSDSTQTHEGWQICFSERSNS